MKESKSSIIYYIFMAGLFFYLAVGFLTTFIILRYNFTPDLDKIKAFYSLVSGDYYEN